MEELNKARISLNLDTNFLKLIAIVCMFIDHMAKVFFPNNIILLIIGRMAFPIFAYCLVVGCLYTHSIRKYIIRLGIFAIISQPFYVLYFYPTWEAFSENIFNIYFLNIFFTLLVGVIIIFSLMDIKKRWWILILAIIVGTSLNIDYGIDGIILLVAFYLFRNNKFWSAIIVGIHLSLPFLFGNNIIEILGFNIALQGFAILSMPLIYFNTRFNLKLNKYIFYAFYPAHFIVLFIIRIVMEVLE